MLLSLATILRACSTPMDARKDESFQSYGYIADRPTVRPIRSMSSFSDSLQCMDRLMRDAQIPTTLVTSKQIPDYSTRVPVATKDMVITALLQMSRLSNAFRYVDYEVDIARQDTVQNLTNILLNNNQIQLQRPALYISGAISFVDENVLNNRMQVGTSASRLETGYSRNRNATIIGLELHLGDFRTRTLIPGLDSANEVIIGHGGQGLDLAGRISDYGWQFNVGRDYAQGTGAAVRTLVELAVIELTGKWARVPYWQCLTMEQTHPDFQRQLRDWFDEGSASVHEALVKQSMVAKGYLKTSGVPENMAIFQFRKALAQFQSDEGIVASGLVDFSTYERALRDYVALDSNGKLIRYGWSTNKAEPLPLVQANNSLKSNSESHQGGAEASRTIDIQIENILLGRRQFAVGEQVFLSVAVSRASYLACYLQSAGGKVMRLLPNPVATQAQVNGHHTIRLPDWMSPNPGYAIETAGPGTEGLLCIATDSDAAPNVNALWQVGALAHIPNVSSLNQISDIYTAALTKEGFSQGAISWQVEPKN